MLFITNRFPVGSQRTRIGRTFRFDARNNTPAQSVYFCEAGADGDHREIGSQNLFDRLRDSSARQTLFFIHGFNVSPDEALEKAEKLQRLCDDASKGCKKKEVEVIALVWPTDDDRGLVKDYFDDQRSALASGLAFARVFGKFVDWRDRQEADCLKRINMIAHSMGGRVLRKGLEEWHAGELRTSGVPMLFRNVFLAAPDLINETLEPGEPGFLITTAARNVVVYHAADDLALRASKAINLRHRIASRRLGHTGPQNLPRTPNNVHSVDCDNIAQKYDRVGHSYFLDDKKERPGVVFEHIFQALQTGRVESADPVNRVTILNA